MRVKSLHLKNFKRFTDISLQDIPQTAQLVLIIGSNGSGKSSVFDAFEYLSNYNGKIPKPPELVFKKHINLIETISIETYEYGQEGFINGKWQQTGKLTGSSFYGRTSFRQVSRLERRSLGGGGKD